MSEKMTRIRLRGAGSIGQLEWGEKSHEEMVLSIRRQAQRELEKAQAILAASPNDFDVAIVRGPYVQHFIRSVEPVEGGS